MCNLPVGLQCTGTYYFTNLGLGCKYYKHAKTVSSVFILRLLSGCWTVFWVAPKGLCVDSLVPSLWLIERWQSLWWKLAEGRSRGVSPRKPYGTNVFSFPSCFVSSPPGSEQVSWSMHSCLVYGRSKATKPANHRLKLWNCEPKQTFPLFKLIISSICYSKGKLTNALIM